MDCILWTGARTTDGYPLKWPNVRYHRQVCAEANGLTLDDIKGQVVRHTCDVPLCINPDHLLLGSVADNMRDRDERDRHGQTKVPLELAIEITRRLDAGESGLKLSDELAIPRSTIYYSRKRVRRLAICAAS